jgi:precorrin-6Y C5,15-methyltransferase (decarboxylating)
MSAPVVVIGLGAEGLSGLGTRARGAIQNATLLAGGQRHLGLVGPTRAETFRIADNVEALLDRLAHRGPGDRCVVLASGDPLFYGIGHRIVARLGREQVVVEPAVSSLQLAFARVGVSWHDAAVASVHGRPFQPTLLPLLGRPKIGLFTHDGDSPSQVARFFLDRGLADYDAWVCQNLGVADESVVAAALPEIVGRPFADLNVLVLLRNGSNLPAAPPTPDDDAFAHPESGPILLTHRDVRALVLRRFRAQDGGPIWDIGAGLGGVSVELARAFPGAEVVAVESSPARVDFLKINRTRFHAYNIRIVEGSAPDCLRDLEPPDGVFLGGSGGKLGLILELVAERLRPGGRLVANFVGLENLTFALDWLRARRWEFDLTQAQILAGRPLAGLTTFVPERPVWIVSADPPRNP